MEARISIIIYKEKKLGFNILTLKKNIIYLCLVPIFFIVRNPLYGFWRDTLFLLFFLNFYKIRFTNHLCFSIYYKYLLKWTISNFILIFKNVCKTFTILRISNFSASVLLNKFTFNILLAYLAKQYSSFLLNSWLLFNTKSICTKQTKTHI